MVTVLVVLSWLVAALLALLVLALVMPVRIEVRASVDEGVRMAVFLRPFAPVGPRIALADGPRTPPDRTSRVSHDVQPKRRRRRTDPRRLFRAFLHLLTDVVDRISIRSFTLDLRFGSDDPGETGQAYGMMTPLIYGLAGLRRCDIRVQPVFDRAVLAGRAALDVSFVPATLLPPMVRFGWSAFGPRR